MCMLPLHKCRLDKLIDWLKIRVNPGLIPMGLKSGFLLPNLFLAQSRHADPSTWDLDPVIWRPKRQDKGPACA